MQKEGRKMVLTKGTINGSLNDREAATVRTGAMHENMAPMSSMRPVRGSRGRRARWKPSGVRLSSLSNALMACSIW